MSSTDKKGTGIKTPINVQKARVEKLMKNPVIIFNNCMNFRN